eukprot:gnl/Dysnectes_brevis/6675_a10535_330.p1 GENE.gnl/Dysnectes_brevis/6675_a10535_330~~gnl/Dysnectes_brevis/6675_a10535_330.p1  ORF type:complete len:214 (-),score=31.88 gnl/Dysnectes_brevis/6675_a10535_330:31-672(-)
MSAEPFQTPLSINHIIGHYSGFQTCSRRAAVKIHLDILQSTNNSSCYGYLKTFNLTRQNPIIQTFCVIEVIDEVHHSFLSGPKYKADYSVDRALWSRFPHFKEHYRDLFVSPEFPARYHQERLTSRYVYLRLKESFLFPEGQRLEGCSFDGTYYMVFDRLAKEITGIYFRLLSGLIDQPTVKLTKGDRSSRLELAPFAPVHRYLESFQQKQEI